MDREAFQEALHFGLGRAILYARENDVQQFRDVILDTCLRCHAVDPQCEGTRAEYMLELLSLTPDRQFYCDEVLKALPGSGDDWDAVQRFEFATQMAFDGEERAKQVMYESFDPGPLMGEDIASKFVRLDGLKGLLFAVPKIGALLLSNPEEVDQGWLWWRAKKICGEQEATAALREAAQQRELGISGEGSACRAGSRRANPVSANFRSSALSAGAKPAVGTIVLRQQRTCLGCGCCSQARRPPRCPRSRFSADQERTCRPRLRNRHAR